MKRIFLLHILLSFGLILQAQNSFRPAHIDSLLNLLETNNKLMVSVSLTKNDQIIYSNASGFRDLENNLRADIKTVYRIGSITKMFTSVMILQLVDNGQIKLSDKLSNFFPEIPESENISIEQLLRHNSGIYNFTDDSLYLSFYTQFQSREQMLKRIVSANRVFEPGERTEYSNSNYIILGYILEDITNKDYKSNLQERIAKPLGLLSTDYGSKVNTDANESKSYKYEENLWVPEDETDMSIPGGAGAVVSTPEELNRFIRALFQGKVLSESSKEEMLRLKDNFGLGIFAMPFFDHTGLGHTGGIDGFRSALVYFPEDDLAIAICSNASNYNPNELLIGVLSNFYGKDYPFPNFTSVTLSPDILMQHSGVYSAEGFPLKIEITLKDDKLFAQATGQQAFPLDAKTENEFTFDPAGIKITFAENSLTILQSGSAITMTKE